MIKTYQGTVYPWNCDHMNHMNVRFYVDKFDQATWNLLSFLGFSSKYLKESKTGMVVLEQKINYLKEVIAGDNIIVESEITNIKSKKIYFKQNMINFESNELISTNEVIGLHIDSIKRKGIIIPEFAISKSKETK